jgi:hypothetical protein
MMAQTPKKHKLDLFKVVLPALDRGDKEFFNSLTPEEKKDFSPLILMRWMSFLGDQSNKKEWAILAVNDLVNIGFWQLSKNHKELQHLLLCVGSLGTKQYHQWVPVKTRKGENSAINEFFREIYPDSNDMELSILKQNYDKDSFKQLLYDAGKSDQEVKSLMDEWKKISKNG